MSNLQAPRAGGKTDGGSKEALEGSILESRGIRGFLLFVIVLTFVLVVLELGFAARDWRKIDRFDGIAEEANGTATRALGVAAQVDNVTQEIIRLDTGLANLTDSLQDLRGNVAHLSSTVTNLTLAVNVLEVMVVSLQSAAAASGHTSRTSSGTVATGTAAALPNYGSSSSESRSIPNAIWVWLLVGGTMMAPF